MSAKQLSLSRRQFLKGAAAVGGGLAATAILPVSGIAAPIEEPLLAPEGQGEKLVRILSLPWPQTPVEQQMANDTFTPASGITVALEGPPCVITHTKGNTQANISMTLTTT